MKKMLHLTSTFDKNDLFDQKSNRKSDQNEQMSIKMPWLSQIAILNR
jgi:hypothetical protein